MHGEVQYLDMFLLDHSDSVLHSWTEKERTSYLLRIYLPASLERKDFALGWLEVLQTQRMPWFSRL